MTEMTELEKVAWGIASPILTVTCVVLAVYFAVQCIQVLRGQDEGSMWKNGALFFISLGIAYKAQAVVEIIRRTWDRIL